MSRMRVLLAERFDVLGCAMDTNLVDQWLFLREACDLVVWSPGLPGYDPTITLDRAAVMTDADLVLLPDLHHGIPGLWDEVWRGAENVACPVVWHLTDFGSAVEQRRAHLARVRPDAVLLNSPEELLGDYQDLFDALGTQRLVVPWGFDAVQFSAERAVERDIDLLVCGCDEPEWVYPVRRRIKEAARTLTHRTVVDLSHPGYWEVHGAAFGRGQAGFADLLRRAKLATTGSAFASLPRKYWESASCGAVGVGDLPLGDPDAGRFTNCSLVIDPAWDVGRIAAEIDGLLDDPARLSALSAAGPGAVAGCDHRARAQEYVAAFKTLVAERGDRRPVPFSSPPAPLLISCPADPESVPATRADWQDVWRSGIGSRTERLQAVLAGSDAAWCVLALDPDAARHVDAIMVAAAAQADGSVAVRSSSGAPAQTLVDHPWALVAAPRVALLDALAGRGVEAAVLALAAVRGAVVLPGGSFIDPAARNAWATALIETGAAPSSRPHLDEPVAAGERFLLFDPGSPQGMAAIVDHARRGLAGGPLAVGVGVWTGLAMEQALGMIVEALVVAGVDLDRAAAVRLLERPLWPGEVAWLENDQSEPLRATA